MALMIEFSATSSALPAETIEAAQESAGPPSWEAFCPSLQRSFVAGPPAGSRKTPVIRPSLLGHVKVLS